MDRCRLRRTLDRAAECETAEFPVGLLSYRQNMDPGIGCIVKTYLSIDQNCVGGEVSVDKPRMIVQEFKSFA